MSIKEYLLEIHSLSLFSTFTPKQTWESYNQLRQFLAFNVDNITNIEYYNLLELNFYLALIIGNDLEAQTCLNRITDNFDEDSSQRIAVLRATYLSVFKISDGVEYLLKRDPQETISLKKRIALTKGLIKPHDYIDSLNNYLKYVPLDVETLAELADSYVELGHYDKAIFSYEEILLIQPFNYIVLGKLGDLHFKFYKQKNEVTSLLESLKQFSRSVELSKNFVQGWSGIYIISSEILKLDKKKLKDVTVDFEKLRALAEQKLKDIVETERSSYENIEISKKILKI